jgi:hypothetical protein
MDTYMKTLHVSSWVAKLSVNVCGKNVWNPSSTKNKTCSAEYTSSVSLVVIRIIKQVSLNAV